MSCVPLFLRTSLIILRENCEKFCTQCRLSSRKIVVLFILALSRNKLRGRSLIFFISSMTVRKKLAEMWKRGTSSSIVDQFSFPFLLSMIIASLCLAKYHFYVVPKKGLRSVSYSAVSSKGLRAITSATVRIA